MSVIDHSTQNRNESDAIFDSVGSFFDQNKKPLLEEYRLENGEEAYFSIVFGGIRIQYGNAVRQEHSHIRYNQGYVQLRVAMKEANSFMIDNRIYTLNTHCYNLIYFGNGEPITSDDLQETGNEGEILKIDLLPELFFKYCPPVKSAFELFRKQVQNKRNVVLSASCLPLSAEMKSIIYDIVYCKKPRHFRHIYLKAKVVELLTWQLEYYDCLKVKANAIALRNEEVQRINEVKQILDQQFYLDHTLLSLSRAVGTNDATLKKHFKQSFGITVFAYLTSVRMQNAKKLLLDGKEKIQVIANKVGYKHATHFTAAFKKYFGYLPTRIRLMWVPILMNLSNTLVELEWLLLI